MMTTASTTQALVDSICRDLRPYLLIPSTFEQHHIQQLEAAIEAQSDENENTRTAIIHVKVEAGVQVSLSTLLQWLTPTLTQLDIEEPSAETLHAVISLIQDTPTLTTLSLCHITRDAMHDLTTALLQNTSIRVLDLSNNDFSNEDTLVVNALSTMLQESTTLQCLMLAQNHFSNVDWLTLSLKYNTSLRMLSLADNDISEIQPLADILQENYTLERLYLHGNKFHYSDKYKQLCSHYVRLNLVGRRLVVQQDALSVGLYPILLARISKEPSLVYGMLREMPQAWTRR